MRRAGLPCQALQRTRNTGEAFEYWTHAAAYLPMRDFRFSLPRMEGMRAALPFAQRADAATHRSTVFALALRIRDFNEDSETVGGLGTLQAIQVRARAALASRFTVDRRPRRLEKTYDLIERVLPESTDMRTPSTAEMAAHRRRARRMLGAPRTSPG